jgi:hypothetical protein
MFETRLRTTNVSGKKFFLRRAYESVSSGVEHMPIVPGSYGHIAHYMGKIDNVGGQNTPKGWFESFCAHVLERTLIDGKTVTANPQPKMWMEYLCEKRGIAMPWNSETGNPSEPGTPAEEVLAPWKQGKYIFPPTGGAADNFLSGLERWDAVVNCQTWAEYFLQKIGMSLPHSISSCSNTFVPLVVVMGFWAVWNFDLKNRPA